MLAIVLRTYLENARDDIRTGAEAALAIPIPLSPERHKTRGYNQVERVVRHAVRELSWIQIAPQLLVRVRHTAPQTSLGRTERLGNVAGAFAAPHELDARRTYIVIDDVTTTGATLMAARNALHEAGASTIIGIALAYQSLAIACPDHR